MENQENVTEQPKPVKQPKVKFEPVFELDKTGPTLHISIPGYDSWINLYINDVRYRAFKIVDGQLSIQLSGPLPQEYRFRAEVLKK